MSCTHRREARACPTVSEGRCCHLKFPIAQDSCPDYSSYHCLLRRFLLEPHPPHRPWPVDCFFKSVCSSGCLSSPGLLSSTYISIPSSVSWLLKLLSLPPFDRTRKIENRAGCGEGERENRSARSIFVCHLSHYFHCSTSHCGL